MTFIRYCTILMLCLASSSALANGALTQWQDAPSRVFTADEIELDAFKWQARPVIIFADTQVDPRVAQQLEILRSEIDALVERDIVIIVDTNPNENSALRQELRPKGFQLVLIGKDGTVKLRKPAPWSMRALSNLIDRMPMRRQEMGRN